MHRQQFVRAAAFSTLSTEAMSKALLQFLVLLPDRLDLGLQPSRRRLEVHHLRTRILVEDRVLSIVCPSSIFFGPFVLAIFQSSARRPSTLRSKSPFVIAALTRRSISSRSIAIARSSFSTPCRLKTRTSTMVPCTPEARAARCRVDVGGLARRRWRAAASSSVIGLSRFGVILPTGCRRRALRRRCRRCPASSRFFSASSETFGMRG